MSCERSFCAHRQRVKRCMSSSMMYNRVQGAKRVFTACRFSSRASLDCRSFGYSDCTTEYKHSGQRNVQTICTIHQHANVLRFTAMVGSLTYLPSRRGHPALPLRVRGTAWAMSCSVWSRVARVRLDNDFRTVAHRTEHGLDVPRLALSAPRLTHSAQRDQHPTLDATPTWKSKTTWSSLRNGAAEIRACRGTRRRPGAGG